jgi:hypothetical protein
MFVVVVADVVPMTEGSSARPRQARPKRTTGVHEQGMVAKGFPGNLGDLDVSTEFGNGPARVGVQADRSEPLCCDVQPQGWAAWMGPCAVSKEHGHRGTTHATE